MGRFKEYEDDFFESKKEHKTARKIASRKDRSKFKKTNLAKREELLNRAKQKKLSKKDLLQGRVLSISPDGIKVEYDKKIYLCSLRGALKQEITRAKNLITVGDFVLFKEDKEAQGSIEHIEARHSLLARQDHQRRRQQQLIAANIDQVLITVSVVSPPLKPSLVDRYIIATYKGSMRPVVLVNKIDLITSGDSEDSLLKELITCYSALDIPVIPLSVISGEGIEALKKEMQGKASVFSGQSGVGKSSLINAMTGLELPIGSLVEKTRKGTHTTTSAQLIPLEFGGWCIDTPGIRSFGIWDLKKEDLYNYFPEIHAISHRCRYPNCTHFHEPGCALEAALKEGKISLIRVESYFKLLQEAS
jgi:ribosome biogenesis GTPase